VNWADNRGPDRRRSGPHPERISSCYIKALRSSEVGVTFLRGGNAERVAGEILGGLTNEEIGPFGRINYYPMLTSASRTPLVRLPEESVAFPFNVIRIPASNDPPRAEQLAAQNRVLYERIRSAGGLLYPLGALPMSPDDWKAHFGPRWALLHDAKGCYDPHNLLTPGYNLF